MRGKVHPRETLRLRHLLNAKDGRTGREYSEGFKSRVGPQLVRDAPSVRSRQCPMPLCLLKLDRVQSHLTREGMAAEGSNSFTLALRPVQGWDIRTAENEKRSRRGGHHPFFAGRHNRRACRGAAATRTLFLFRQYRVRHECEE
jgi:hypothetical protein